MPNNKTTSETSSIESTCRVCLTRTFTDPDLHDRLKKEEEKNNLQRSRSQSLPRTPCHTPNSSYTSIPSFYISSPSSSEMDSEEDIYTSIHRRYTF